MMKGVYCIYNTVNEKVYIGCSVDVEGRMRGHTVYLRQGRHGNRRLQADWNIHGEKAFLFTVLIETKDISVWEKHYIAMMRATNPECGYNTSIGVYKENRSTLTAISGVVEGLVTYRCFCGREEQFSVHSVRKSGGRIVQCTVCSVLGPPPREGSEASSGVYPSRSTFDQGERCVDPRFIPHLDSVDHPG
jgi:hypothetical protein